MKKGNIWPIPYHHVVNGGILSRKNADRLLDISELLYKNNKYSASLVFSTLGLEEYGKFLMLYDSLKGQYKINSKDWYDQFTNHDKKLHAIPNILFKQKSYVNPEKIKKEKKRINGLLQKWGEFKLQSLYLDWDSKKGKWKQPDDNDETIKNFAKESISLLSKLIDSFKKDGGELVNETTDQRLELLKSKKAYAMCQKCGLIIFDIQTLKKHGRHPVNQLSWHSIS